MSEASENGLGRMRYLLWGVLALPLIAPLVAMQMGDSVQWTAFDFIVAALLLGGTGLGIELFLRRSHSTAYRFGALIGVGGLLFLVWANLAVGIVGSENDPFNLFYFLALPIVALGAAFSRLKAKGMARTMAIVAALCVLMALAGLVTGKHLQPGESLAELIGVNALFAGLFTGSALLFERATRR
ncbi:hypothetical protein [Sphingomicrobium lutaoense]|uniref:Putative membrane channel-forming protein YqfA (Hemolysin III family) n=1 Tax=Sphingomicrobium lutaoense TaxID=515949 RepID=A0A839Z2Y6_9SPHN|nr:hypothetical protein [Sphingomicrobium lutaoense]MBB3764980.1 putative membrane channel-forming protein YqfA (hemolysin III family) [Sphingomicrobium lutaoense]